MFKRLDGYSKDSKKAILIYSGELLAFGILFIVLGILFLVGVIPVRDWKKYAFVYVTMIGGLWPIADFIWALASPKHRKNAPILDKVLLLPVPLTLIPFDIYALCVGLLNNDPNQLIRYFLGGALCYISLIYFFQGVYHYFKPLESLIEEDNETQNSEHGSNLQ